MEPDTAPFSRYLLVMFATVAVLLGLAWVYTANFPMAFMESGYAAWAAKSAMLRQCRLGQIAFFGDSRLEAGVVPAELPVPATNFAFAAGTAVEARAAIDRALRCPELPRQAVLSLVPEHFGPLSKFYWLLSVRYGFISAEEALSLRRRAAALGDLQSLSAATPEGLTGAPRDLLYASGFPTLSFGSLIESRLFGRLEGNRARLARVEADRGWAAYTGGEPVLPVRADRFIATKLQDAELRDAIAALRARHVAVALLVMPFSTDTPETEAVLDDYLAHLAALARDTGATLLDPAIPRWSPTAFADGAHLAPPAAHAFTKALAACVRDGVLAAPCTLPNP